MTMLLNDLDPMVPHLYTVQRTRAEIPLTSTMELQPASGNAIAGFAAGQFNMVYVFGVGEIPISISGDPCRTEEPQTLVHTTRAVGAVSRAITALKAGDMVGVRGPFGTAWPLEQSEGHDVVLVAGGIGLAPLRPTVYHILAHRERYSRVALLYGARQEEDLLFQYEIASWEQGGIDVAVTVDQATPSWHGHVGVVTRLLARGGYNPATAIAMICGPEIMMRFTALGLEQQGIGVDRIYVSSETCSARLGSAGTASTARSSSAKMDPSSRTHACTSCFKNAKSDKGGDLLWP
jgi:NAD(P)H-flavin reductase